MFKKTWDGQLQIDRSVGTPHYVVDRGGVRITDYDTGDTCLRQPWMTRGKMPEWNAKLRAFADDHPGCFLMTLDDGVVIDDIRTWPHAGDNFGYKVGDRIITFGEGRKPHGVLTIVSEGELREDPYSTYQPGDVFQLEDGSTLYWSQYDLAWSISPAVSERGYRVRPVMDGDPIDALTLSDEALGELAVTRLVGELSEAIEIDIPYEVRDFIGANPGLIPEIRSRVESIAQTVDPDKRVEKTREAVEWLRGTVTDEVLLAWRWNYQQHRRFSNLLDVVLRTEVTLGAIDARKAVATPPTS